MANWLLQNWIAGLACRFLHDEAKLKPKLALKYHIAFYVIKTPFYP